MTETIKTELLKAIKLAQNGQWDESHRIVQEYNNPTACWIHAVLHKIEGDESNSRYWYARCDADYEGFLDVNQELEEIHQHLKTLS